MATFGSFPGVQVTTQSGGITSIAIGEEEKVVIFGEANYDGSNDVDGDDSTLSISTSDPEQINSRNEADAKFGSDSELADGMKDALSNGANIDFLYGVAVPREDVTGESITGSSGSTGTLSNANLVEDTDAISFDNALTVEFRYDGAPATDGGYGTAPDDTIFINPFTAEYAVTSGSVGSAPTEIDYTYNDWNTAFTAEAVRNVVNEDETGVYVALEESDSVSSDLQTEVSNLRDNYQLVTALMVAEPNDSEVFEDSTQRAGADARYDAASYGSANQSVTQDYFYKFAPGRQLDSQATVMGAIAGLFAGNPIDDPIYNETISSQNWENLEQSFSKTQADTMRGEDIIPLRDGGSIRVRGNRSTNFSASGSVAGDFFTRRITDRVILIAKQVGDTTIGKINDQSTRSAATRLINAEMRDLVDQRLIKSNDGSTTNWFVEVTEDSNNDEQVNIDISFTPFGIVKEVDATVTVDTN